LPLSAGSGSPIVGDLYLNDGSGNSPSLHLTAEAGDDWEAYTDNTLGMLVLTTNDADGRTIWIVNGGAGAVVLDADGEIVADSFRIGSADLIEAEFEILDGATTTTTQLNYLNAATGTTGTTSTNLVFSGSPTLATPTATTRITTPEVKNGGNLQLDAYNAAADSAVTITNTDGTYNANVTINGDLTTTTTPGIWTKTLSDVGNNSNVNFGVGTPVDTGVSFGALTHGGNRINICSDDATGTGDSMACDVSIMERGYASGNNSLWNTASYNRHHWSDGNYSSDTVNSAIVADFMTWSGNTGSHTMSKFGNIHIKGTMHASSNPTITDYAGIWIEDTANGGGAITNNYGIKLDARDQGATTNYQIYSGSGEFYVKPDGETVADELRVPNPPSTQTITSGAGDTITADHCGGLKRIDSAADIVTDLTNTITASAAANDGCIMHIQNTGNYDIILDGNAGFNYSEDFILRSKAAVTVMSDGSNTRWNIVSGQPSFGESSTIRTAVTSINATQIKSMHSSDVTVIPAPPAGWIINPISYTIYFDGGTAYTSVDAGDDLRVLINNVGGDTFTTNGHASNRIETTGWLEVAADAVVYTVLVNSTGTPEQPSGASAAGQPMVMRLGGAILTGTGTMKVVAVYNYVESMW
jgi:hypothetical protein